MPGVVEGHYYLGRRTGYMKNTCHPGTAVLMMVFIKFRKGDDNEKQR